MGGWFGAKILGTCALQHPHVQPCGHLHFGRVHFVGVQHLERFQLRRSAAWARHTFGTLQPNHALEERVMVRGIVPRRTSSVAVAGVEAERLHDELEALNLLEDDVQAMTTTALVAVCAFRASGHAATTMMMTTAPLIGTTPRCLIVAMLTRALRPSVVGIRIGTTDHKEFGSDQMLSVVRFLDGLLVILMDNVQLVVFAMLTLELQAQIGRGIQQPRGNRIGYVQIDVLMVGVQGIRVRKENASTVEENQAVVYDLMDANVGEMVLGRRLLEVSGMVLVSRSGSIMPADGQSESGILDVGRE